LSISRFLGSAAFLASLAIPVTALAQQTPPPATATFAPGTPAHHGHRHGNGLRKALRSLNLSAAQQTQIDQAFAQTRQANRNADQATRKVNRRQLRSRIDAILTPAQRAQLKTTLQRNRRPA
jgi:Spy/CpxP family protein refolding chaperone